MARTRPCARAPDRRAWDRALALARYLLGFGEVAFLLQYNAITNEFTSRMTYPDPRKAGGAPPTPGA